jgi:hypothetical protein
MSVSWSRSLIKLPLDYRSAVLKQSPPRATRVIRTTGFKSEIERYRVRNSVGSPAVLISLCGRLYTRLEICAFSQVSQPNPYIGPPYYLSSLCGVVVSVIATGPKGRGFKLRRGDGFLRVIKVHSTPSLGWEVKPEVPCRKILQHVKDQLTYQKYWIRKILIPSSIPPTRSRCLCW